MMVRKAMLFLPKFANKQKTPTELMNARQTGKHIV